MKEQHNPALTHLKSFMRWGDLWAWSFYGWAFIAGLEKYRKDKEFFKNHCFILRVQVGEATGKPIRKSQAFKAYKYHSSSFMTESEFKCAIHETIFSKDKETQSRYEDQVPRENNVVRIIILLESGHGLRMQLHQYLEAGFLAGFGPTSRAEGKALFDKLTDTTIAMLEDGSEQVIGTDVETRPKNFDGLDVDALAKRVGETYKERLKADMDVGNAAGFVDYIRMMQKEVTRETHMWLQVD
ncbi:hypothetical protein GYMLUDRAFT_42702 [Collybiopsis luxurians FD-317 M1]|uniref:Uncharacterized protein n=1 Tax=Collybiopsis luxurians FD-317 M1 TaxID=944289 RepID=A0A0D0CYZ0_9AGAR|nr:hypothetical protein GYMLUDRAFT_42702 [Collybiopsis luxurians FD-317 M1]